MAGNIVKWWKHKILGGYKQFTGEKSLKFTIFQKFLKNYGDENLNYKSLIIKNLHG